MVVHKCHVDDDDGAINTLYRTPGHLPRKIPCVFALHSAFCGGRLLNSTMIDEPRGEHVLKVPEF